MMTRDPANPWTRAIARWTAEDWTSFHSEITDFVRRKYGITPDSALGAVLEAQAAVMPQRDLTLPKALAIAHDVAAYFESVRGIDKLSDVESRAVTRLADHPPATLTITDPEGLCQEGMESKMTYDDHCIRWELNSALMAGGSVRHYVAQA